MTIYYTYHICWSNIDKHYYGVRYAKTCHPGDLWVSYFTSSKRVKAFRDQYGEPDIIEVRKTFETKEAAILWETKVLTRLGVVHNNGNDKWLNRTNNRAILCDNTLKSEQTRRSNMSSGRQKRIQYHLDQRNQYNLNPINCFECGRLIPYDLYLRTRNYKNKRTSNMFCKKSCAAHFYNRTRKLS